MWDNRIFNINGKGKEMLLSALRLALAQRSTRADAAGYALDSDKGMVLLWHVAEGGIAFPAPLKAEQAVEVVWTWLESGPTVLQADTDSDYDHDGHNSAGWRVYCEDWGHVALSKASPCSHYAIVAIKPVFLWYGK